MSRKFKLLAICPYCGCTEFGEETDSETVAEFGQFECVECGNHFDVVQMHHVKEFTESEVDNETL